MKWNHALKDSRSLRIALLQPEDAPEVIGYVNEVGGESDFLTFGGNEFWLSVQEEETFLRALGPDSGWMMKGVVDGRLVSTLSLMRTDRPRLKHAAELGISVRKPLWSNGIGGHMCRAAIELARGSGVRKINLRVRSDNAGAIHLYEKLGFRREGESSRAYVVRGEFHSNVIMGLEID